MIRSWQLRSPAADAAGAATVAGTALAAGRSRRAGKRVSDRIDDRPTEASASVGVSGTAAGPLALGPAPSEAMTEESRFSRAVLPSGIVILGERMDSVRSVAVGAWVRVGSRHESARDAGMTHFLEHVVFKGTRHRDAGAQTAYDVDPIMFRGDE